MSFHVSTLFYLSTSHDTFSFHFFPFLSSLYNITFYSLNFQSLLSGLIFSVFAFSTYPSTFSHHLLIQFLSLHLALLLTLLSFFAFSLRFLNHFLSPLAHSTSTSVSHILSPYFSSPLTLLYRHTFFPRLLYYLTFQLKFFSSLRTPIWSLKLVQNQSFMCRSLIAERLHLKMNYLQT